MTKEELWKVVLGEMELSLSKANFTTWFKNTSITSKEGALVVVNVPNGFVKEWLENKFHKQILGCINNLEPNVREIKYQIGNASLLGIPKKDFSHLINENTIEDKTNNIVDVDKATNLNKRYTLESFIVGSNNELA